MVIHEAESTPPVSSQCHWSTLHRPLPLSIWLWPCGHSGGWLDSTNHVGRHHATLHKDAAPRPCSQVLLLQLPSRAPLHVHRLGLAALVHDPLIALGEPSALSCVAIRMLCWKRSAREAWRAYL
eukprot:TRINITY_DN9895_c0_g1_i1.p2 TRINITY_DN9895_c0_g1~~TRINITY_DN9895_c0_g1_i1.p2  ORF type:complete len:124 (-),score=5.41 TRINITY_DN9895_c0_g1_i1:80-451(-)